MSVPIDDGNCFACGPDNPIGMHLQFELDETGQGVISHAQLGPQFQGWRDIAHGGIAMSLLDEAMAHAAGAAGHRGVTASLTTRFRKPVPLGKPLVVRGRVGDARRNVLFLHASVSDADGVVLLEGEGKFVSMGRIDAAVDRRNPSPPT
jgi:acyl-coenzyme A thioesterase PaaI-like protein